MELKDVVGPTFMSPIESMDWVDHNHIAVRYGDHVELLNVNKTPPEAKILLDSEALVSVFKAAKTKFKHFETSDLHFWLRKHSNFSVSLWKTERDWSDHRSTLYCCRLQRPQSLFPPSSESVLIILNFQKTSKLVFRIYDVTDS